MAGALGYVSSFASGGTLTMKTSATSEKSAVGDTRVTLSLLDILPSGAMINYNGTSNPATRPGDFYQDYGVHSGGVAYYAAAIAKKGLRGTATKTLFAGGTETCTAELLDVRVMKVHSPSSFTIRFLFRPETDWA